MKTFIVKGTVFTVLVVILIEILNWCYVRTEIFDTERFEHVPDGIQVCNVGASYSRFGFDYEDFDEDLTTFNFAITAQSADYDYRILDYYKDKLADGCIVFIVLSNYTLVGCDETQRENFKAKNRRYYTFLPDEKIKEFDLKTKYKVHYLPFIFARNLQEIFLTYGDSYKWVHRDMEGRNLRTIADHDIKRSWLDIATRDINGKAIPNDKEIKDVCKIVSLCKEIGAIPVLIITPYTKDQCESIAANAEEEDEAFYDAVAQIQADTGADLYDYSHDERFINDYSLFMDAVHMNRKGAKAFTATVMEEIVYNKTKEKEV